MKISISIGSAYYDGEDWEGMVELVQAADRLGVDAAWSAEAWGMEAVSSLGYLAAKTERIGLGSGIMQITARVPTMAAMTALSLAWIVPMFLRNVALFLLVENISRWNLMIKHLKK